jgi:hypothetical protein
MAGPLGKRGKSMSRAGSEEVVQAGLEMMAAKGELLQKIARINGPGLHECVICCALLYGNDSVAYHAEWHKRLDGEVE